MRVVRVYGPSAVSEKGKPAGLADDAHDVGFLHDEKVFAVKLDFSARPLAEQDAVAGLDVESDELAVLDRKSVV